MDALVDLRGQVEVQAAHVRKLKADGLSKDALSSHVDLLKSLKAQLQAMESQLSSSGKSVTFDRTAFEELMKRRFFFFPSFHIYGGVSGLYDYGPPGCGLQANIMDVWRKHFVLEEDMLEVDTTVLTPHDVLKTSGHVERFADLMCRDTKTGDIFRVDHLVENALQTLLDQDDAVRKGSKKKDLRQLTADERQHITASLAQIDGFNANQLSEIIAKYDLKSPVGNPLSPPETFNLMFATSIGPTGQLKAFLRPETAQGQFVNFKKLLEFNQDKMPFASAQIGRSFRNEISPRSGLLRVREFLMAEIEHYVHPERKDHPRFHEMSQVELNLLPSSTQMKGLTDITRMTVGAAVKQGVVNNETLGYFLARVNLFLIKIGIKEERLRFRQHLRNEMAHYACDCWDAEIHTSYGWIECVGNADRSAFDLTKHSERTREKLVAREALKEPRIVQKTILEINKKLFGPAFKRDAKAVETHLLDLNEAALKQLGEQLRTGHVRRSVACSDTQRVMIECRNAKVEVGGQTFTLTPDMAEVKEVTEKLNVLEYIPNVIEPSFGVGRIMYSLMEHVWWQRDGDENRHVLSFPPVVAPIKCLIVPISANKEFEVDVHALSRALRKAGLSARVDDSGTSIGRRYARNDELGTPFAITVDFQTLQDRTVTLRERDSTKQIRTQMDTAVSLVTQLSDDNLTWANVLVEYPLFISQEVES